MTHTPSKNRVLGVLGVPNQSKPLKINEVTPRTPISGPWHIWEHTGNPCSKTTSIWRPALSVGDHFAGYGARYRHADMGRGGLSIE